MRFPEPSSDRIRILFPLPGENRFYRPIDFSNAAVSVSSGVPFDEARLLLQIKSILPTTLTSSELEQIPPAILERSLFSAQTVSAEYLQELSDQLASYIKGDTDFATARLALKNFLDKIEYRPLPDEEGTLTDLSSDARINLVLDMNSAMATGYGRWMQGQRTLDAAPAQELYRAFQRKVPRNWIRRWQDAGGSFYKGRMIALKNDGIWKRISRFGLPYPPFDYNSGMRTKSVDRQTAMDARLIDLNTRIAPESRDFNEDLKVSADIRDQALKTVLEEEGWSFRTSSDGTEVLTP